MKSLKRFGFVLVSLFVVLGLANVSFAQKASVLDPSWTVKLTVTMDGDDEADAVKIGNLLDADGYLKGLKLTVKDPKATFSGVKTTTASFATLQRAVDYAEELVAYVTEWCADGLKGRLPAAQQKAFGKITKAQAEQAISTMAFVISVSPGNYEGFSASGLNLTVYGTFPKGVTFSAKRVGQYEDEDYDSYVIVGKGKGDSAISVDGGICVLENLYIEGGKSAVGGGVYFGKVYGGLIRNCYFENNTASYGAAIALLDCVSNVVENNLITNNKVTRQGKAGGALTVMGGENNVIANNWIGGNKAVNGLSAGLAVYQGKRITVANNIVKENSAAKGYPNFQIILGGTGISEDDETSKLTGLNVDANIVMGCYKTNKAKYMAKNEYGIAEEIGERSGEFIDVKNHRLVNNGFVYGSLNYAYRNSVGARQFKNISMENFEDVNNPENTGSRAIRKADKNEIVFYKGGWRFSRKISGRDYRKRLRPKLPTK